MLQNFDTLDFDPTVDARDQNVGTGSLVLVDFLADALGLALVEGGTFNRLVVTKLVVVLNVDVV